MSVKGMLITGDVPGIFYIPSPDTLLGSCPVEGKSPRHSCANRALCARYTHRETPLDL
ncbi:hypothetical protein L208DRAFT_1399241 [Tricholoma matsutake]|nr:hypothetical protein L208DRAFT_1410488 [Tricholoma matsutake 945]KAF8231246.1 hypothetical protein L208DRAFT_1399241 [Tricholoma matsutake 945]